MKSMNMLYTETALIESDELTQTVARLRGYTQHLQTVVAEQDMHSAEASILLPTDDTMLATVRTTVDALRTEQLKYIVVVGIGGSNLGAQAIYQALYGAEDAFLTERRPKMLFADTVSAPLLGSLQSILEQATGPEEIIINIISKSGTTTETVANFETLLASARDFFPGIEQRILVTTDEDSTLWRLAVAQGLSRLALPAKVGGRYSVFSAVGLAPLALAGVDIEALLAGARAMRERVLGADDLLYNDAAVSASLQYIQRERGLTINNTFFFNPELEVLGKWYRQLMGESLGKERNRTGEVVRAGITPLVSLGSTDLHSMAQLYFGGPRDKFTYFVAAPQSETPQVPAILFFEGLVAGIAGRPIGAIMQAIFQAVKTTYRKQDLPFVEVVLPEISEYVLGEYMQFRMLEMMYLAELCDVNAFDQPNVEDYKAEMRLLLS